MGGEGVGAMEENCIIVHINSTVGEKKNQELHNRRCQFL